MLSKWQLRPNMSQYMYGINMAVHCSLTEDVILVLYRMLRQYCSWRWQMREELQHMEMLPGIFNEDNDGKCNLI